MLGLPLSASGPGFLISLILLTIAALTSIITSLLILEVLSKTPDSVKSFSSMSAYTLGSTGLIFCTVAYLVLLLALSCAFVSGGASMIKANLHANGISAPNHFISVTYVFIIACVVYKGHQTVDWANRILFSLKGVCFFLLTALLFHDIKIPLLIDTNNSTRFIASAIPILFFSFGLQIVVPSVFYYLNKNIKSTRKAIIAGSLLPFTVYVIWLTVTLGILPRYGAHSYADFLTTHDNNNIGDFFLYINKGSNLTTLLIIIFANVAIATSYATIALSLKDFIRDSLRISLSRRGNITSTLLTFVPTLVLVMFASDIFQQALNFSAAIITIVLILIPIAMVIAIRRQKNPANDGYTSAGGTTLHILLAFIACILFVTGILASMDKLPTLS